MATAPLCPRDLTIPEPGSTTAKAVLSRAMGRLLRDLSALPRLTPTGAREEGAVIARLSRAALADAPGALMSALRRPTVGGLLRCLRSDTLPQREAVMVELAALLAFELALAGALAEPVRLRRFPARLLSISARIAIDLPRDASAVAIANGRVTIERAGRTDEIRLDDPEAGERAIARPYHVIAGDIALAEVDNNPLSMFEAHPDKEGNAIDLGGRPATAWTDALGTALARIERHLPDIYGEMQLFVAQVVPVGWHDEKHLSASYQEMIGTIYMTLHPSQMTLSEALIHEFSHNKINALFEVDEVLENAWSPLYTSPVRPDPRPLHGVLLAVHAFLPVARLYEQMIANDDPEAGNEAFRRRYAAIRKINREGAELVLDKGRPTAVGAPLFDEIRRWHEHYAALGDT
ncbi:Transcriptional regulator [Minicystis rosea]|nr:Transcriptional regulator [Minicystis rosea]